MLQNKNVSHPEKNATYALTMYTAHLYPNSTLSSGMVCFPHYVALSISRKFISPFLVHFSLNLTAETSISILHDFYQFSTTVVSLDKVIITNSHMVTAFSALIW